MSGVLAQRIKSPEGHARRFLVVCMVIGFAGLALIGIAAAWLTARTSEHTQWVNHSYQVEVSIGRLQALIEQAETTRRGYVLTGIGSYADNARATAARIRPAIDAVAALTADNPRQTDRIAGLKQQLAAIAAEQDKTIALTRAGRRDEAVASFAAETGFRRMRAVRGLLTAMLTDERSLLDARDAAQQSGLQTFWIVLVASGVLIVAVAAVSLAAITRYTRDLTTARDRLQLLNTDLEGAVAERTADLSRANEEIQRFAYIVSHDLRSPLVNVMGFTSELDAARQPLADLVDAAEQTAPEIVTDGARLAVRQDLPEAIGFIRTSTQKMDRLINAILKLSREGRRVLTPEALPLDEIAAGIRDSLSHLASDRGAEIIVDSPLPDLVSDRLAVEQILSNLVENAVKYLSPDRAGRIVISGQRTRDRVLVEVSDNGRGIAAADHARIFDLFRRSGTQDQPGEGIGLAHVRALAYRLGGTIDVTSTFGEGSIFRLSLPFSLPDAGTTA